MDFNKREGKVLIKALNGDKLEPLSCILWQSFKQTWEQNSTYQIEFTAMDDGSESYKNLAVEATIYFDNQQYTVKQPIVDHDGTIEMKSVTALHISNEVSRVHQYQTQKGTLTYSVNDVLAYYLKDNQLGFTYNVFGSFDKVQIANLGNGNGKDMLSKIVSAWQNAIFFPDNKAINIYTPEMFHKNLGNRIIYRKDTSDIKLTYDSTSITNQVKVFGKQKDNSDADNPTYYFEPHLVQNSASIAKWGLFPASNDLSDERFEDAKAIDEYAATTLQPDPTVTLDVSYIGNDKPKAGETRRLEIREKKWNTNVNIVSFVYYPFDRTQNTTITFNNAPANFLDSGSTKTAIENLKTAIANVNDKAGNALVSANGKNHNWYSDTDPAKTHANELAVGDIWFFDDGDDSIEYSWNGVKWIKIVSTKDIDDTIDLAKNNKKDADQMRADANARFEEAEKNIASISDDMSKTENDLKSVDAKFDSKTDTLNQSIIQAKSDISDQVDQLKTVKSTADSALKKANGNDSSISTINQNIDKINGKFDLTATKTDIDTVNKKYTQQQAQIDANTKGITLKASQDSVNTLSQTVTSNSSSLSVLSNEVKQKTSKTDFDTLTGRVSNAEQKIDATADGVTSTVSKVEGLQTQVDNSAVGTNLFSDNLVYQWLGTTGNSYERTDKGFSFTIPAGGTTGVRFLKVLSNNTTNTANSGNYTVSGKIKATSALLFEIDICDDHQNDKFNVGTDWQSFSFTRNATSYLGSPYYGFVDFQLAQDALSSDVTIYLDELKIEKGTKATDWSANPADNATVTALNVVKQTADETYEGLFNKDGSNKIDVTAQGLKAQIETAKESAQGYAKTTIDAKAGEFNASLSSVQTTLQNDATTKANNALSSAKSYSDTNKASAISTASSDATTKADNALNNAKSYADNKATVLQTDYDNKISNTSKGFTEKWTAVTKQVSNLNSGSTNLMDGTGMDDGTTKLHQGVGGISYAVTVNSDSASPTGKSFTLKRTDGSSKQGGAFWELPAPLTVGKQYSWTIWAKGTGSLNLVGCEQGGQMSITLTSAYTEYTKTFTATSSQYYEFTFYGNDGNVNATFLPIVLVEGNISPTWCRSINDNATRSYAETLVNAKAGSLTVDLKSYTDNAKNAALNSAKSYADTQISATAGTLTTKVNGADYHNLISMNGNGILLDAHGVNNSNKSIILSGDHIKMDSNNPVTIPNAAITELDAGKLKVGSTLNAANVNLINLNADHISSGTLTGVSFHQSSSGHDTWIDGNGVHDYDNHGNNAWIQKGRLQVYDSANQGFFMDAGKLQLTSASAWSTSANPVFGIIKRDSNIFSTSGNGMIIQGTDGLSLRSKSFDSDNGWWEQSSRYDGSGINIKDSGILMASNGRMVITGGTVYKELFNSLPKIEVGTNAWTPNGTGGEAGQNIALKANGIMMDMNGGMYISSYSGGTAEFHNMNVKANSFTNTSLLSKKTNITKLDPAHALSLINKTDIYDYQYKSDVERGSSKHYASFIIDDVNEVSEYTEPDEFLSEDKTGRDDGTQLAYATLAIQELSKQINDLKQEIKNIKQKIGE